MADSLAALAAVEYNIAHRSAFTQAVAELDSAVIRRAHKDALIAVKQLETLLAPYRAKGQLPPALDAALRDFSAGNAARLAALSDDLGRALTVLLEVYQPPRGISYWYKTRFRPWWQQDDSL